MSCLHWHGTSMVAVGIHLPPSRLTPLDGVDLAFGDPPIFPVNFLLDWNVFAYRPGLKIQHTGVRLADPQDSGAPSATAPWGATASPRSAFSSRSHRVQAGCICSEGVRILRSSTDRAGPRFPRRGFPVSHPRFLEGTCSDRGVGASPRRPHHPWVFPPSWRIGPTEWETNREDEWCTWHRSIERSSACCEGTVVRGTGKTHLQHRPSWNPAARGRNVCGVWKGLDPGRTGPRRWRSCVDGSPASNKQTPRKW